MAKAFECEVRYKVEDIEGFRKKLKELNAELCYSYQFIDHYFKPKDGNWNVFEKTLRIREKFAPEKTTKILFDKIETISFGDLKFKRSVFPEGKLMLYSGDIGFCKKLLNDLGFEEWIEINKKEAELWKAGDIKVALENIEGFGWALELEFVGEDVSKAAENIDKAANVLGLDKSLICFEPISIIYARSKNLL